MRTMRAHGRRITSTARRDARVPRVVSGRLGSSLTSGIGIAAPSHSAILSPLSPKDFFAIGVHGRDHEDDRADFSIASALRSTARAGVDIVAIADNRAMTNTEVAPMTMRSRDAIAILDGSSRGDERP